MRITRRGLIGRLVLVLVLVLVACVGPVTVEVATAQAQGLLAFCAALTAACPEVVLVLAIGAVATGGALFLTGNDIDSVVNASGVQTMLQGNHPLAMLNALHNVVTGASRLLLSSTEADYWSDQFWQSYAGTQGPAAWGVGEQYYSQEWFQWHGMYMAPGMSAFAVTLPPGYVAGQYPKLAGIAIQGTYSRAPVDIWWQHGTALTKVVEGNSGSGGMRTTARGPDPTILDFGWGISGWLPQAAAAGDRFIYALDPVKLAAMPAGSTWGFGSADFAYFHSTKTLAQCAVPATDCVKGYVEHVTAGTLAELYTNDQALARGIGATELVGVNQEDVRQGRVPWIGIGAGTGTNATPGTWSTPTDWTDVPGALQSTWTQLGTNVAALYNSVVNAPANIVAALQAAVLSWVTPTVDFETRFEVHRQSLNGKFPLAIIGAVTAATVGMFSGGSSVLQLCFPGAGSWDDICVPLEPGPIAPYSQTFTRIAAYIALLGYFLVMGRRFLGLGGSGVDD